MSSGKKLTQEEFEERVYNSNPDIKITGKYINIKTKVSYLCPICNIEHEALPQSLMAGRLCKKNIGKNNPYKKDTAQFIKEILKVDKDIKIIGEYINADTPIEFICKCGKVASREPAQMLLGYTKCPRCAQGRYTWNEFIEELHDKAPNLEVISEQQDEFVRLRDKVKVRCDCFEHTIYDISIEWLLKNQSRCPKCRTSHLARKDFEIIKSEVESKTQGLKILSEYTNSRDPIDVMFPNCNHIVTIPHAINIRKTTQKCPVCLAAEREEKEKIKQENKLKNARKTTEQFIKEMKIINPKIKIIGEYINAETKIDYICECGKQHSSVPSSLLYGGKCGHCSKSRWESKVCILLERLKISYEDEFRVYNINSNDMQYIKFDFNINDEKYKGLKIEIDGEHHFRPVNFKGCSDEEAVNRYNSAALSDNIKNQYCKENNYELLRIPYWNFKFLEIIIFNKLKEYNSDLVLPEEYKKMEEKYLQEKKTKKTDKKEK